MPFRIFGGIGMWGLFVGLVVGFATPYVYFRRRFFQKLESHALKTFHGYEDLDKRAADFVKLFHDTGLSRWAIVMTSDEAEIKLERLVTRINTIPSMQYFTVLVERPIWTGTINPIAIIRIT
jgi:hypothetical protein